MGLVMIRTVFLALLVCSLVGSQVFAQPGGRGGRGGGEEGGRGGFGGRGGGEGGFGGRGGGGPTGGFGGRGGSTGGFGGRGGSTGGFGGRGGTTGGFGGRGGFDPSSMLSRFDRNGNGMIDQDEKSGFAGAMLARLAERDKSIDLSKPVSISKLAESLGSMRGGAGAPGGGSSSSSDEPALLVPDFSLEMEPLPPEGFGNTGDMFSIKVEDRDIKEAEERIRRYDKNGDKKLSKEELRAGRWSDDPMQYDRNKDGSLTASELAARYANRRVDEEERRSNRGGFGGRGSTGGGFFGRGGGDNNGWNRSGEQKKESAPNPFGKAKSFKLNEDSNVSGLPSFFARSDKNLDGQVMMNEFSSSWTSETLKEFLKWDLNNDGVIVADECLAALEGGARVGESSSSSSSSSSSRSSGGSTSSSSSSSKPKSSGVKASNPTSQIYVEWAQKNINKYDKNGDGALTANEWEKMIIKPTGADANGDGVITVEEYAAFRASKRKK